MGTRWWTTTTRITSSSTWWGWGRRLLLLSIVPTPLPIFWVPDPGNHPPLTRPTIATDLVDHFPTLIPTPPDLFIRGDVNNDQLIDISDVLFLQSYLLSGGLEPAAPLDRADVNDDGLVNMTDVQHLKATLDCGLVAFPIDEPHPNPGTDETPPTFASDPAWELRAVLRSVTSGTAVVDIRVTTPAGVPDAMPFGMVAGTLQFDPPLSNPVFTATNPGLTGAYDVNGDQVTFHAFGVPGAPDCDDYEVPGGADILVGALTFQLSGALPCDGTLPPLFWVTDPDPNQIPPLTRASISSDLTDREPSLDVLGCDPMPPFIRGDVNNDGLVNGADIAALESYLFPGPAGGQALADPIWRADLNDDQSINATDLQYLGSVLLCSGPLCMGTPLVPAEPFPFPGDDETLGTGDFGTTPVDGWELRAVVQDPTPGTLEVQIRLATPVSADLVSHVAGTIQFDGALTFASLDTEPPVRTEAHVDGNQLAFYIFADPQQDCDLDQIPVPTIDTLVATIVFVHPDAVGCDGTPLISWVTAPNLAPPLARATIADELADHTPALELEGCGTAGMTFTRGDVDGNGNLNPLIDASYILAFGFSGGPAPECMEAADVNGNGAFNAIVDAQYLLTFGFVSGPPPPPPTSCGLDPDPPGLGCDVPTCLP